MVELRLLAQGGWPRPTVKAAWTATDSCVPWTCARRPGGLRQRLAADEDLLRGLCPGVNAYLYRAGERVALDGHDYRAEYWKAEDSALLFELLNFAQAVDLRKETAALALAAQVAW